MHKILSKIGDLPVYKKTLYYQKVVAINLINDVLFVNNCKALEWLLIIGSYKISCQHFIK